MVTIVIIINYSDFPQNMYVIEDMAIDGILLLQKKNRGNIYVSALSVAP